MRPFEPTYGARDTFKNVYGFMRKHQSEFWALIKNFAPYLLFFVLANALLQHLMTADLVDSATKAKEVARDFEIKGVEQKPPFNAAFSWFLIPWFLVQIFGAYVAYAMAITWHRLVLLGVGNYEPMRVFKPKKHEIIFMLMGIAIIFIAVLVTVPIALFLMFLVMPSLSALAFVVWPFLYIFLLFLIIRMSFYLPAKALNSELTLRQAFAVSKGYVIKFILCSILVFLPFIVFLLIYGVITAIMPSHLFSQLILQIPLVVIVQPFMTLLGVTILSNYYQHALQNKGVPSQGGGMPNKNAPQENTSLDRGEPWSGRDKG